MPVRAGLPFDDLLAALDEAGLPLGVAERLAFARLLARYDGTSRDELRAAIASLLARSAEEAEIVGAAFDRLYPEEVAKDAGHGTPMVHLRDIIQAGGAGVQQSTLAPAPPLPTAPRPRPSAPKRPLPLLIAGPLLVVLWLVVLRVSTCGVGDVVHDLPDAGPAPIPTFRPIGSAPRPEGADFGAASDARPAICPPRADAAVRRWPLRATLLAAIAIVTLAGLGAVSYRKRLVAWTRGLLRRRLANLPGPRRYDAPTPRPSPRARAALDDMAAVIEAALDAPGPRELDPARTVDRTVRAGLRPTPVYRPRARRRRALLLHDVGHGSAPFQAKMEAFARRLAERGVDLERYVYDRDPSRVATSRVAPWVALDALAARTGGLPLLLLGTGEGLCDADRAQRARVSAALEAWPARALLTPIADPELWPAGLLDDAPPLAVFPMDRDGLRDAAEHVRALRRFASAAHHRPRAHRPPIDPDDVRRLRGLLALDAAPSFELAELLRRRFLPHAPEEIVLGVDALVREAARGARREAGEALARLRESDPDRREELEARRFLLAELDRRRPSDEASAAYLRWRADVLLQRLHLAQDDATLRAVCDEIAALAATPVRADLERRLAQELDDARRVALPAARVAALRDLALRLGAPLRRDVQALGRRPSRAPDARAAAAVIAASALVAACLHGFGAFAARPPRLDGGAHLLWTRDDVRMALCAFDGFADVHASDEAVYGVAVAFDDPAGPARVFAFRVTEGALARTFAARPLDVLSDAERRTYALTQLPAGELRIFVSGGAEPRVGRDVRLDTESLTPIRVDSLFEGKNWGWAPHFDEANRLVHFSWEDRRRIVEDRAEAQTSFEAARWQRDLAVGRASRGIMPGAAAEIIERITDPGASRWAPPEPGACPPSLSPCAGVCVDTRVDPIHCGACDRRCPDDQKCVDGTCACAPGKEMCDDDCVDTRSDPAHCGACGRACAGGKCVDGACAEDGRAPCPQRGQVRCGDACVDLQRDPKHCGECGNSCLRPGLSHHCGAGRCEVCLPGFQTCDPADTLGCGTNIASNPRHCGRCGNACPVVANAATTCRERTCTFVCNKGFADCDGVRDNGCEMDVRTDVNHCGGCGKSCGPSGRCNDSRCVEMVTLCQVECEVDHRRCVSSCDKVRFDACRRSCDDARRSCLSACKVEAPPR